MQCPRVENLVEHSVAKINHHLQKYTDLVDENIDQGKNQNEGMLQDLDCFFDILY